MLADCAGAEAGPGGTFDFDGTAAGAGSGSAGGLSANGSSAAWAAPVQMTSARERRRKVFAFMRSRPVLLLRDREGVRQRAADTPAAGAGVGDGVRVGCHDDLHRRGFDGPVVLRRVPVLQILHAQRDGDAPNL